MDFVNSELYLLHEIVLFLDRTADGEILPPFGIGYADCLLLIMIRHHSGSTQQELADLLNVGKSSLSQRLGSLLSRGLVTQEIRPENRRERSITLTPSGVDLTDKSEKALVRAGDSIFKSLPIRRAELREQLSTLRNRLAAKVEKGS